MFKNFIQCPFRVYIPQIRIQEDGALQIEFDVEIKADAECRDDLCLSQVNIRDQIGLSFFTSAEKYYVNLPRKSFTIKCGKHVDKDKIRDYSMGLFFTSEGGECFYDVYYEIESIEKVSLCLVNTYDISDDERTARLYRRIDLLEQQIKLHLDDYSEQQKRVEMLEDKIDQLEAEKDSLSKSLQAAGEEASKYKQYYMDEIVKNESLLAEIMSKRKKKDEAKAKKFSGKEYEDTKAFRDAIKASRQNIYSNIEKP